ncbi:MAG TPA: YlxR family protein [Nocardioides sp.]|nr:YlxR family protein [Nocardioides sp.]
MARASVSRVSTAVPGPFRTCIGCRERAAKSELLRVTAGSDADGRPAVVPDPEATRPGRGAHLHPTSVCYDLAVRRRAFGRALRVTPPGTGLDSAPVAAYLASLDSTKTAAQTDRPTRNWSSSS